MGRSVILRYSAAQKLSPQIVPKITIFIVLMNKTQILLFALVPRSACVSLLLEEVQSTWWLIPDHWFSKCQKNVKSVIGTRDDKQWPTEGGSLKDGCTGVADASAKAS